MRKRSLAIYLLSWLLMAPYIGHSQNLKIDSLHSLIVDDLDANRSEILLQLAQSYMYTNIRKVPSLLDSAFSHSNDPNNQLDLALFYQTKGIERWLNGYYPQSRRHLKIAAKYHQQLSDSINLAKDYKFIGINYLYDAIHDSALISLDKSLVINRLLDRKAEMVENLDHIAVVYRQLGNYDQVLKYSTEGLDVRNSIKGYSNTTKYYSHGGQIFNRKAFDEAIRYHKKVLNEVDKTNKEKLGLSLNNIGSTFMNVGMYDSAIYYYRQSTQLIGESTGGNSFAGQLNELGEALFANQQYAEAETIFKQSKQIWDSIGTRISVSIINYNLARTYLELGETEIGLKQVNEVQALAESMSKNAFYSKICLVKARYLMKLNDPESAMKEATIALDNALRLKLKEIAIQSYQVLAKICLLRQDPHRAIHFMEKYTEMKDSLYNEKASIQLAEMQVAYETEKKNQTIESLNAQFELKEIQLDQRNFIIVLTLIILLISIFLILNRYRYIRKLSIQNEQIDSQKYSLMLANREKEFMLYEIHHRVKNNLQMIISMLNIQSNKIKDKKVVEELGKNKDRLSAMAMIHQQLYEGHQLKGKISINEYLLTLINQLISTYQTGKKIKSTCDIDPIQVNYDTAIAIGLIVNELVCNALKHAFRGVNSPCLHISLKQINEHYKLVVRDNGVGSTELKPSEEGFGIKLISSFVQELEGEVNFHYRQGTAAEVVFNDPTPKQNTE